ncbi:ankyrin repeat protein (macronuclear) [Tetrahymena thermophila SB210]|uniref:Ankyrin repeat protein n=1 Tax=Tetrahymena thermophila (strain SB210) TaxID=312017 RepID=I7M3M7_TETTS|nr:ankyrin repeat protein [Tetrahymena thermophila SB210]EAS03755.1 ankyrin repeat protein [Tetrahymena thermophila SB210]|eukprot:XP_001024000.1 ankyrin repeat protein [Tetrahymena thermophila SB210]
MNNNERPLYMTDQQHVSIKNNLYHAIKRNDLEKVRKMIRLFQIEPGEEISTFGNQWTPIHYAIFFKSSKILEFLIQLTYLKNKNNIEKYIQIMNMPTKSGHSPLMVGAVYDTVDCLKILFQYGGLQLFKKDCSAMDCIKLAIKYDSKDANDFIQDKIAQNNFQEFLEVNLDAFKQVPDLKTLLHQRYEVQMPEELVLQNRDILLYGEPISCIICLQNTGFLKYSNCCGQPLHQHCHAEKIIQCPLCKSNNFYLISEVLHPNRAFTFNPNSDYIKVQQDNTQNKQENNLQQTQLNSQQNGLIQHLTNPQQDENSENQQLQLKENINCKLNTVNKDESSNNINKDESSNSINKDESSNNLDKDESGQACNIINKENQINNKNQ